MPILTLTCARLGSSLAEIYSAITDSPMLEYTEDVHEFTTCILDPKLVDHYANLIKKSSHCKMKDYSYLDVSSATEESIPDGNKELHFLLRMKEAV